MSEHSEPAAAEFSRIVDPGDLPAGGLALEVEATPAECAALARRLGILGISGLKAQLSLRQEAGFSLVLRGDMVADVEQACVVTLEPVKSSIASAFSVRYISPATGNGVIDDEEVLDDLMDGSEEDTEILPDGPIDVGEVVSQYLSLALDPYPRKAGATLEPVELTKEGVRPATKTENPFGILKKLQDKA